MIGRPKGSKGRRPPRSAAPELIVSVSPIMKISELCEYLQIHKSKVYRLVKAEQLPSFKVGSELRFHSAAIDAWTKRRSERVQPR